MLHDDYLSCASYQGQPAAAEFGYTAFYREDIKRYFFAVLDSNGDVLLKSEGYPQEKSRDAGMASVIKNRELVERYAIIDEGGRIYLSLKAGNRKEIARSCEFKTKAEADKFIAKAAATLTPAVVAPVETKKAAGKTTTTKVATEKAVTGKVVSSTSTVSSEKSSEQMVGKVVSSTVTKSEGKSVATKAAAKTLAPAMPLAERPDDYLFATEYLGHPNLWDANGPTGYATFQHDNGQFYFAVYNPGGSIYLRSEGFTTVELREDELAAVKRNIENNDRYKTKEIFGKFVNILVDENDREVGRSTFFDTFAEAFSNTPYGRMKTEAVLF
jgi:uncharacterized protein YegP (UPF0339 family)